ncbi:MAG: c-type cytochrome [Gammaproteobacteria bacterium]|nr:c-type cytochrome [Gammaproteobacteria bacterium]
MKNNIRNLANVIIFTLGFASSQPVVGYSGGIIGYSGNPATNTGNTCATCHSGGVAPSINLSGPTVVRPGTINNYTLTISGGQQNSGGLNISASSGTLISTLANTKLQVGELTHTARATAAVDGTVTWNFSWQSPASLGSYVIYSAGLSTNANSSTTGDGVANIATAVTVSNTAPQPPTAVIHAPMTAQIGATVSFDGSASYDPDGIINQYTWNFDNGKTASGAHAINNFATAGVYTVTLTVTDSDNLTHTTFKDITVGGVMIPVADPGASYTGTAGQPVNFDGSLSTHVEAIVRYVWDFGDGSPVVAAATPIISHTFASGSSYTVTLAVQDAKNITGVASTIVVISATPPPPPTDGAALYATYCRSCHGALATSTKLNRTITQIQTAINTNAGGVMGTLNGLTPTQVQAIADALVSTTPPPPATDGATLYANNCQSCHGALATSTKLNRTAAQIQTAIAGNAGGVMGSLSGLTATQIQAIATALGSITPVPTTGEGLYNSYCSSCHGVGGRGGTYESVRGVSTSSITSAINGVPLMNSISLTPGQKQAIATYLSSGNGGGD